MVCLLEELDSARAEVLDPVLSTLVASNRKENPAAAALSIEVLKRGDKKKLQVCKILFF